MNTAVVRHQVQRCAITPAQACDDCATTAAVLKLLDSFESLLDRPALAADLRREHQALVAELGADLAQVCIQDWFAI